jgi:hypothetical protein
MILTLNVFILFQYGLQFAGKLMQIWRCLTAALYKKKDTQFELTVSRDSRILFV